MSTIPNRSSVSLLALCCAALASGVVAFDPPPAGFPTPPSRSAHDHRRLLEAAGLALTSVVPTSCRFSLIEAVPHA